jgi:hypothetical protein
MIIRRTPFFLWLLAISFMPFLVYKLVWIAGSVKTVGTAEFQGKSYTGQLMHVYTNIRFRAGKDSIWFNGNDNILYKDGEQVPVRYQQGNPSDARLNIFSSMWGDTLVYGGIPVCILLLLFLHPHIIPYRSRLRLTKKQPYIWIVQ